MAIVEVLVTVVQQEQGDPVSFSMSKDKVKSIPQVMSDPYFSNEANWKLVSFIFKHLSSARRLTPGFRSTALNEVKKLKLKPQMKKDDLFELHKIIISDTNRTLLVIKRDDIENASSFDFVLNNDGPL